jgi:hypothetical protein
LRTFFLFFFPPKNFNSVVVDKSYYFPRAVTAATAQYHKGELGIETTRPTGTREKVGPAKDSYIQLLTLVLTQFCDEEAS